MMMIKRIKLLLLLLILGLLLFPLSMTEASETPQIKRTVSFSGGFKLHKSRLNIAKFTKADSRFSHQEDFYNTGLRFIPNKKILIKRVTISLKGLKTQRSDFFLGDNCLYVDSVPDVTNYKMPLAAEIHCTGTSVWKSSGYVRSLSFDDPKKGFIVDKGLEFSCPMHAALIYPEEFSKKDIRQVKASCEIEYSVVAAADKQYKFIRIPYLDQYPDAPSLIKKDIGWYKNWQTGDKLKIAGFSLYFNPKPFRDQILKNVCIYAVDKNGQKNESKQHCLEDQIYIAGQTHLQYEPAFVEAEFSLSADEFLSASCDLYKGNKAGDCVLYVLVEIPNTLKDSIKASPTYYSNGIVNFEYLQGNYCSSDIFSERLTPFGKRVISNLNKSDVKPWSELDETKSKHDSGLNSYNCKTIFID